jgi:hypothetical protein
LKKILPLFKIYLVEKKGENIMKTSRISVGLFTIITLLAINSISAQEIGVDNFEVIHFYQKLGGK